MSDPGPPPGAAPPPGQQPAQQPAQQPPPPGPPPPPPPAPYAPYAPYGQPGAQPAGYPPGYQPGYAPGYQPGYQAGYQPGYQAGPQTGYQQPSYGRPVYKPGTIPLRPLTLSDMFSGAIETIRRNPRATIGLAAVVLTAFMMIPAIGTLIWGGVAGFGSRISTSSGAGQTSPQDVGLFVSLGVGSLLAGLATVVLTGMIVHVVEHAARGEKLSAGAAWRLTRHRRWRLVVLAILNSVVPLLVWIPVVLVIIAAATVSSTAGIVVGILTGIGGLVAMVYLWVRLFQLAAASMVVEQRGVFSAMGRSWELTRGAFWRIFGITLLTLLVATIAGEFLAVPFAVIGGVGQAIWPDTLAGLMVLLLSQNVAKVVAGALTTPFSASISALLYLDQRIRKEGYDIELISRGTAAPGAP